MKEQCEILYFHKNLRNFQVLKKVLQFGEKVDIKNEANIIQYRVNAKAK